MSPLLKNSLDLGDNAYRAVSFSSAEKETKSSTVIEDKVSSGSEAIAHESPSTSSVVLPSTRFTIDAQAHVKTTDGGAHVKTTVATVAVTAPTITTFGSDKPALSNGSTANPSLFNFANKNISSAELSTSVASSKEIAKSAPVFGLEKVDPSKEAGGPSVNFDTKQNVFKVPPIPFTASSSVGGESTPKFGASFDSQPGGSIRLVYVSLVSLLLKTSPNTIPFRSRLFFFVGVCVCSAICFLL